MKKLDEDIILDEIRGTSKVGYSSKVSIVDILLNAHWCEQEDLLRAYETLQNTELDIVIAFFQLPFLVRLPARWIKISSGYSNPFIYFRTVGTLHNTIEASGTFKVQPRSKYDEIEKFTNAILPNDCYGLLARTQVLISFELSGKRLAQYDQYSTYQGTLQDPKAFESKKIYPAKGIISSRPLTAQTYEMEIADTLRSQITKMLNEFIPVYAVSCGDPFATNPQYLENYFIMVKPSRIVIRGLGNSSIAQLARPYEPQTYSHNLSNLKKRLESGRPPSIYERYLLEAARQIELGAGNLAIVQTVMILDLFANEIINDRLLREIRRSLHHLPKLPKLTIERIWQSKEEQKIIPSTLCKFTEYLPSIGLELPSGLKGDLKKMIKLRNKIVHHIQAEPIKSSLANEAVNLGLLIIQHCMNSLLNLNKNSENNGV